MEKTGLAHRFFSRLERDCDAREALATSKEADNLRRELDETLKVLKSVKATRDILFVLGC